MTTSRLTIAANGHCFLTFEECDTPEWQSARQWLIRQEFIESGEVIVGLDEVIFPSFVKGKVVIEAGSDHWSGNHLLALCQQGDRILIELADYVAAVDYRPLTPPTPPPPPPAPR